jgi:polyisoprenoid-binding protein YceI
MKKTALILGVFATAILTSCSSPKTTEAGDAGDASNATSTSASYTVDVMSSTVTWKGSKKMGENHVGTIAINSGSLSADSTTLTAGEFEIDMKSMKETDPASAEMTTKLMGHLSSADFFAIDTFPTATFVITGAENGSMKGNLTIKGITKEITAPATLTLSETGMTATSSFSINRKDWGITWGASSHPVDFLKDNFVNDNIDFTVNLVAVKN